MLGIPNNPISAIRPVQSSGSHADFHSSSKSHDAPSMKASDPERASRSTGRPQKQTYPLYPSVAQLLREKGIPVSEADKIPASGPKGRLLKGDVLAYLGTISPSYSSDQSARISKLGHLDLSNVQPAIPKESPEEKSAVPSKQLQLPEATQLEPPKTEIALPISLSSVVSVQQRIQTTLGVTLPLSTFIARAAELANDGLPRSAAASPTADELFNDVLGLSKVSLKTSRGHFVPQITALPKEAMMERAIPQKPADVYDILTGTATSKSSNSPGILPPGIMAGSKPGDATNIFSVHASTGEEKRARVFLERVKTVLQVEPGRLIL